MFLGEYRLKFQGLGRIALPGKLRPFFREEKIILVRAKEGYLFGFSRREFEKAVKRLEDSQEERTLRLLYASSESVELDRQGRFVIPSALRTFAKVQKSVLIIGVGNHFEIWNEKLWFKQKRGGESFYAGLP